MEKLYSNYHTHTFRCGHALENKDEEYVLKAIELGYKNLGFSDHGPFKNIIDPRMRMDFENGFKDYLNSILTLKEKYKDKINIHLGLEIEYIKEKDSFYKELFNNYEIEYLIIGQHMKYDEDGKKLLYFKKDDRINDFINYKNDLIDGINSGYFTYVAHPDLFFNHISKITPEIDKIIEEICLATLKKDIPLEININGETNNKFNAIKKGNLHYPSSYFFKKANQIGNKFIFGVDAHAPSDFDKIDYDYFTLFLKETGIDENKIIKELKF